MKEYIERAAVCKACKASGSVCTGRDCEIPYVPAADVVEVRHAKWKYFHKQNKAVCTNCSFERDLDADFGRAVACPNCGARMDEGYKYEIP